MTEVVDPSLELQQLAHQALSYQVAQQQQQQQQQANDAEPTYVASALEVPPINYTRENGEFFCPFPTCQHPYKRKDLLKRHMTQLLASPDEHHKDEAIWEAIRATGVLTVYTRPRNLTEDQKKQRRKESNLRHRLKYSDELKEKRNRKRRIEKLLEGKQVGVQTPDWDAEASANAAFAAAAVAQIEAPVAPPTVTETAKPAGGRGRRSAKSKGA
jgi:hypothetical protein